ncbi:MAG: PD40 domain-containing protein [Candidatus Aminicenantes bacterium]|nr:MAG: PD40 domain-containing protein [Candidatus Aminicenantes bacterium]
MKKYSFLVFFSLIALVLLPSHSMGIDTKDTTLLAQPAVSSKHIAFVYANDLWIGNLDGKDIRRLTSDIGVESNPAFSPDGRHIAFSAQYDGNTDVYIISVEGGVPKRLTWHPSPDIVRGFTPDGKGVLFISPRYIFQTSWPFFQIFTVSVEGGFPESLNLPYGYKATYSPDGTKLAYIPLAQEMAFPQWKHYRGGAASRILIYKFSDHSVEQIPQPEGRCNDSDPMWIGDKIYFLSDRNGEFNLFSFNLGTKEINQLTQFDDFPILHASAGGGKIIYEREGYLHTYNLETQQAAKLTIGVAADLQEVRPRYVKGFRYIRNASISSSGKRAVFEFRGEIITVPAEKGDPRNLTNTPGAHERSPIWSPDGKKIAYFSDESGEYELHVKPQDGKGKAKKFKLTGSGFYMNPLWSPDSKKITFADHSFAYYWIDLSTRAIKKYASEPYLGLSAMQVLQSVWSPDSRWIAYTKNTKASIQRVFLYSIEQDKSYPVSDGLSEVANPVFDASGKYLYFFGSTDAGPVKNWFAQSNMEETMTSSIYMAVLQKGVPSPLAKESDEEKIEEKKEPKKEEPKKKKPAKKEPEKEKPYTIDFDGLEFRILSLPVTPGTYFNLQAGSEGQIFYMEIPPQPLIMFAMGMGGGIKLHKFDLKTRKAEVLTQGINSYALSADKKKILYLMRQMAGIAPAGKIKPGQGKLNVGAIEVRIEPRTEWRQIYHEAWRLNRDSFYATNMHGADWNAMYKKYEKFLPHLTCRNDLNRVLQWLGSELAVGHHFVGGGDTLAEPKRVQGGLLGADYSIENNRYRFNKIYGGLNWNPQLRSPLTEPGVDVKKGEYLLAVQGEKLSAPTNLYSLFENTSGKITEITVGPNPDGSGSRTVSVVPIGNEQALRNRDWVEGNIKKVDKATGGRVAYVYVPNTAYPGNIYFKRYFYPQVHKDAIIIDERYNGGGMLADYYIDHLRRPYLCYWHTRYGDDIKTPSAAIYGPKVMIINESAGSGGDFLPWMFRKLKIGKLVGKRTWGGLVGNLGHPILMDGGSITAPNLGIWTEDGWIVENVGVPPDVEVEEWPADVIAGRDPQLEKAIEIIMEELKKNPPKKVKRPPYPVRVKK